MSRVQNLLPNVPAPRRDPSAAGDLGQEFDALLNRAATTGLRKPGPAPTPASDRRPTEPQPRTHEPRVPQARSERPDYERLRNDRLRNERPPADRPEPVRSDVRAKPTARRDDPERTENPGRTTTEAGDRATDHVTGRTDPNPDGTDAETADTESPEDTTAVVADAGVPVDPALLATLVAPVVVTAVVAVDADAAATAVAAAGGSRLSGAPTPGAVNVLPSVVPTSVDPTATTLDGTDPATVATTDVNPSAAGTSTTSATDTTATPATLPIVTTAVDPATALADPGPVATGPGATAESVTGSADGGDATGTGAVGPNGTVGAGPAGAITGSVTVDPLGPISGPGLAGLTPVAAPTAPDPGLSPTTDAGGTAVGPTDATTTGSGDPGADGSSGQPGSSPSTVPFVAVTVADPSAPAAPGSPGVPVSGVAAVNGPAAATEVSSASASSTETANIIDQVTAQIGRQLQGARTLRDGTHHTVLRLSPEHLGDVTITLDVRAGGVRIDLAAGPVALAALQADIGQLRDDLAGSGLDLSNVTLSSSDPGTNGQNAARDRRPDANPSGAAGSGGGFGSSSHRSGSDAPAPPPRPGRNQTGGLDVLA